MPRALLLALSIVIASSSLSAQIGLEKPINLYLHGGTAIPMGDLSDFYDIGITLGGAVGYTLPTGYSGPRVELLGDFQYASMALTDGIIVSNIGDPSAEVDGGDYLAATFGAGARLKLPIPRADITPGVEALIGVALLDIADYSAGQLDQGVESRTDFYFSLGVTAEFGRFFARIAYVAVQSDLPGNDYLPLSIGIII